MQQTYNKKKLKEKKKQKKLNKKEKRTMQAQR